jgi:hypothetical protein
MELLLKAKKIVSIKKKVFNYYKKLFFEIYETVKYINEFDEHFNKVFIKSDISIFYDTKNGMNVYNFKIYFSGYKTDYSIRIFIEYLVENDFIEKTEIDIYDYETILNVYKSLKNHIENLIQKTLSLDKNA